MSLRPLEYFTKQQVFDYHTGTPVGCGDSYAPKGPCCVSDLDYMTVDSVNNPSWLGASARSRTDPDGIAVPGPGYEGTATVDATPALRLVEDYLQNLQAEFDEAVGEKEAELVEGGNKCQRSCPGADLDFSQ